MDYFKTPKDFDIYDFDIFDDLDNRKINHYDSTPKYNQSSIENFDYSDLIDQILLTSDDSIGEFPLFLCSAMYLIKSFSMKLFQPQMDVFHNAFDIMIKSIDSRSRASTISGYFKYINQIYIPPWFKPYYLMLLEALLTQDNFSLFFL